MGKSLSDKLSSWDINNVFSREADLAKPSAIRLFLKYVGAVIGGVKVVSLGGGLPDPSLFPTEEFDESWKKIITHSERIFQYGKTGGVDLYVEELKRFLEKDNIFVGDNYNNSIITTVGSQQALDFVARLLINEGDAVGVGSPTYLGALSAFNLKAPNFLSFPVDKDGLDVESLESKLKNSKGLNQRLKFVYVIPDFQNPAGVRMSLDRRKKLLELSREYKFIIVEDAPYRMLDFSGKEKLPSIYELAQQEGYNNVILLGTFSKILSPGIREGWIVANSEIIEKVNQFKQAAVLCGPTLNEYLISSLFPILPEHINKLREVYGEKKDIMVKALEDHMPKELVSWNNPEGGFFLWLKTPCKLPLEKAEEMIKTYKVIFIPGGAFDPGNRPNGYMRLNFTYPSEQDIEEGVKRLSNMIKTECKS